MLMYSSSLVFTKSNCSIICSDYNGDQSVASRKVLIRSMAVVSEMVSIAHMVIVQRFIRTASSWYVFTPTAYMPQGCLAHVLYCRHITSSPLS